MGVPLAADSTRPRMTPVAVIVVGAGVEAPEPCAAGSAMAASATHRVAASRWMSLGAVEIMSRSSAADECQLDRGLLTLTHGERGGTRTYAVEELSVLILVLLEIIQRDRKVSRGGWQPRDAEAAG